MDAILNKLYYDPSNTGGFKGVDALYKEAKKHADNITKLDVRNFLKKCDAYTFHKPVRFNFPKISTIADAKHQHWQCDLSDLSRYKSYNDNNCFILFIIDVYTRYLWLKAIPNKKPATVAIIFEKIFNEIENQPAYICSDLGHEFISGPMKTLLEARGIGLIHTYGPHKSSIVERVQRTIKERMFRYFTHKITYRYIDILDSLAKSYNESVHRTIKTSPLNAFTNEKYHFPIITNSKKYDKSHKSPLVIDDKVRISRVNRVFIKGYHQGWSTEVFTIYKISSRQGLNIYFLKDFKNTKVIGGFYREELQEIHKPDDPLYRIDKIIRKYGSGKKARYLVSWLGYPQSFNSIIPASDIVDTSS